MTHPRPGGPDGEPADPDLQPGIDIQARPYLATGGRTRARGTGVAMETVVVTDRFASPPAALTGFERGRILDACRRPRSVAEVAALLDLPLTVALVVVDDLVDEGLLVAARASTAQADDVGLLERLLAGVHAL